MTEEDLKREIERLRNENASLKQRTNIGLTMKVSEKGAVSVYGLGKWPITLYKRQWIRVLDIAEDIRDFIVAHESELSSKD